MKQKIAVESQLSNISEYLTSHGYDVLEFQHNQEAARQLADVAAIVTSGMDQNFLGMHDIKTEAPVIEASGYSPQQIKELLDQRLS